MAVFEEEGESGTGWREYKDCVAMDKMKDYYVALLYSLFPFFLLSTTIFLLRFFFRIKNVI
jgi:hypothetical protein